MQGSGNHVPFVKKNTALQFLQSGRVERPHGPSNNNIKFLIKKKNNIQSPGQIMSNNNNRTNKSKNQDHPSDPIPAGK